MNMFERLKAFSDKTILLQLLVGGVLLVIIFVLLFISLSSTGTKQKPSTTQVTPPSRVTPTSSGRNIIPVLSPANGTTGVNIYTQITMAFPRQLSTDEQQKIRIVITPNIRVLPTWQDDKILTLTPITLLKENQTYSISVSSPFSAFNYTFTTASREQTKQEEITKAGLTPEEIQKQYPWYNDLPLYTGKYLVTFDLTEKKFLATLYISREAQIQTLKDYVLSVLKSKGINTTTYPVEWKIVDESK